ncbi:olfactory receptor 52P1-like [Mantella aurantiaca]
MFTCSTIVYITWSENALHEPMYIFICNLVIDVMYGNSTFFPKFIVDLLTGGSVITLFGCLSQAFFIQIYSCVEVCTFTAMAYDRYLAVAEPLRYHTLMSNRKAAKLITGIWIINIVSELANVTLTGRLTFCGKYITNIVCETMSLLYMACGDTTANNIFGMVVSLGLVTFAIGSAFCYIGTFAECLKISLEAKQKAFHTLITHVLTFSIYMTALLFAVFRYRLNVGTLPIVTQLVIIFSGLTLTLTLNPLVYGIRVEALRRKINQHLQKPFIILQINRTRASSH